MSRGVIVRTVQIREGDEATLRDTERIIGAWPKFTSDNGGTNWIVLAIGDNAP